MRCGRPYTDKRLGHVGHSWVSSRNALWEVLVLVNLRDTVRHHLPRMEDRRWGAVKVNVSFITSLRFAKRCTGVREGKGGTGWVGVEYNIVFGAGIYKINLGPIQVSIRSQGDSDYH
jgi:hypothetical protein